jgi:thiol-disulfide isomerase/thioredoxin
MHRLFEQPKADFLKMRLGSPLEIDSQQSALHAIAASIHTPWCATVLNAEMQRTEKNITDINKALAASRATAAAVHRTSGNAMPLGRPLFVAPFGATLYKAEGLSASDLLSRISQAFPGKAIIIDRWATWCGPCIGEMPHGKQLQQDAADLPVVFVYLCTKSGSSEEKWKNSVFNMQQPGIHIFIDEKLDVDIGKALSFAGYPGYAFIDREGKYKPGAIRRITDIADRKALETLVR